MQVRMRDTITRVALGIVTVGFIILASFLSYSARGEERPVHTVLAIMICEAEKIEIIIDFMRMSPRVGAIEERFLTEGTCILTPNRMPLNFSILEVVEPPVKDWAGDWMYRVRVGDDKYAVAWPGFNSTLPQLMSL